LPLCQIFGVLWIGMAGIKRSFNSLVGIPLAYPEPTAPVTRPAKGRKLDMQTTGVKRLTLP
jgi:hypothetical protein